MTILNKYLSTRQGATLATIALAAGIALSAGPAAAIEPSGGSLEDIRGEMTAWRGECEAIVDFAAHTARVMDVVSRMDALPEPERVARIAQTARIAIERIETGTWRDGIEPRGSRALDDLGGSARSPSNASSHIADEPPEARFLPLRESLSTQEFTSVVQRSSAAYVPSGAPPLEAVSEAVAECERRYAAAMGELRDVAEVLDHDDGRPVLSGPLASGMADAVRPPSP